MRLPILLLFLLSALYSSAQSFQYWGYSNMEFSSKEGVAFNDGSAEHGLMLHLTPDKSMALKGSRILGIRTCLSTKSIASMAISVRKSLEGDIVSENAVSGMTNALKDYLFDTPVEIDGSGLYVGFRLVGKDDYHKPLIFDHSGLLPAGLFFAYTDAGWIDISQSQGGAPVLQLIIDKIPADYSDVLLTTGGNVSYMRSADAYHVEGELLNLGQTSIHSLDIVTQAEGETAYTTHMTGLDIAPHSRYAFTANGKLGTVEGNKPLHITITKVNGQVDYDVSDNKIDSHLWLYTPEKKHHLLVEKFTGQGCMWCPVGEDAMEEVRIDHPEMIPVAHHSYLRGDVFTVNESVTLSYFFNASAFPAFLVDRLPFTDDSPFVSPIGTDYVTNLRDVVEKAISRKVDVALDMDNQFDAETRKGELTINIHTFNVPNGNPHALNLWLTQDSLTGVQMDQTGVYQRGYKHNHTLRSSLIEGAWGEPIELNEGETLTRTYHYTLPDSLMSTFTGYKWQAIPENMQIVAFVGDVTKSPLTCMVHNANVINLGCTGSTTNIVQAKAATTSIWNGDTDVDIYTTDGRKMGHCSYSHWNKGLPAGVYVLRSAHGSKVLLAAGK